MSDSHGYLFLRFLIQENPFLDSPSSKFPLHLMMDPNHFTTREMGNILTRKWGKSHFPEPPNIATVGKTSPIHELPLTKATPNTFSVFFFSNTLFTRGHRTLQFKNREHKECLV